MKAKQTDVRAAIQALETATTTLTAASAAYQSILAKESDRLGPPTLEQRFALQNAIVAKLDAESAQAIAREALVDALDRSDRAEGNEQAVACDRDVLRAAYADDAATESRLYRELDEVKQRVFARMTLTSAAWETWAKARAAAGLPPPRRLPLANPKHENMHKPAHIMSSVFSAPPSVAAADDGRATMRKRALEEARDLAIEIERAKLEAAEEKERAAEFDRAREEERRASVERDEREHRAKVDQKAADRAAGDQLLAEYRARQAEVA